MLCIYRELVPYKFLTCMLMAEQPVPAYEYSYRQIQV